MVAASPPALLALERRVRACAACALRPGCSGVVAPQGLPGAPVLLVGGAPGVHDDREGRPFVGPAGGLLERILAAADLSRDDVALTHVVKCRPPGDRPPTPQEVQTCAGLWLGPHFALTRPRVVVTLGNVATQALLRTTRGVGSLRGQWFTSEVPVQGGPPLRVPVMPLFHPAYLLSHDTRAPGGPKSLTWRDIREVAAVLRGEKRPGPAEPGAAAGLFPPGDLS